MFQLKGHQIILNTQIKGFFHSDTWEPQKHNLATKDL